jgi:hypothetical protein
MFVSYKNTYTESMVGNVTLVTEPDIQLELC